MGAGIVQVAAQSGYNVTMVDLSPDSLSKGQNIITSSLRRVAKKKFGEDAAAAKSFIDDVHSRIQTSTDSTQSASQSQLVIEAIVEHLKAKQDLFRALDNAAPKDAILASNTSSLPIGDIAKSVSQERKSKMAGLHFFNPVPQMKLVEIIRIPETSEEVYQTLFEVTKKMGKSPVACKDTPG